MGHISIVLLVSALSSACNNMIVIHSVLISEYMYYVELYVICMQVTWLEHVEVDNKTQTHRLYRDLMCSSCAYGAERWVVTLQRTCERLLAENSPSSHDIGGGTVYILNYFLFNHAQMLTFAFYKLNAHSLLHSNIKVSTYLFIICNFSML